MLPTPRQAAVAAAAATLLIAAEPAYGGSQNNDSHSMAVREVIDRTVTLTPGAEVSLESIAGPVTIV